ALSRDLASNTLLDVYEAIEPGPIFGLHPSPPDPECVVGHGIGPAMSTVYSGIEATRRAERARTTLEDVLRDVLKAA
ncbi:MAG: Rrf2 family transcriptional regulator, partial [Actinomycetes bacterium]